jgi:hypothetical protein
MHRLIQVTQSQEFYEGEVNLIRRVLILNPLIHHLAKPFCPGSKEPIQNMIALSSTDKLCARSLTAIEKEAEAMLAWLSFLVILLGWLM